MGCLVVSKKKKPFLLVPQMEYERAKEASRCRVIEWKKGLKLFEALEEVLAKQKISHATVGVDQSIFSISLYKSLRKHLRQIKVRDITKDCLQLRAQKTKEEIQLIRKSCRIADSILKECIKKFHTFKTEKEVEVFLHTQTIKRGCTLAFDPIIASGKGASMPHYEPQEVTIRKGFCVIDFGVNYKGYHSDITRTIYLGNPKEEERKVYSLLLQAQREVIRSIRTGKLCSGSYKETQKILGEYAEYFTHGLGHGIGLQIHELPNISPNSKEKYQNNQVFTIEPGIYMPGKWGMRIEDDILIYNGKREVLTKVPRKLITIKAGSH